VTPATPSSPGPSAPAASAPEPTSPARYGYLVARLRNRQITMEEATELFGVLQGMLRDSQTARVRLERTMAAPPPAPTSAAPRTPPSTGGKSDDLLLLGLLALGAGAGLGAAFARRWKESNAGATSSSRTPDDRR
jgi:hypothetical protein